MNSTLVDLGFFKIQWYSLFIFVAIIVAGFFILRESKKWKIPEDFVINMIFFAIPLALLGARLYYVAFNWSYYSNDLLSILKVWEGGLAIHGGILAGLIWVIAYTKKYKVDTYRMLDIIVVGLIIGQAIGRWGNFFNQEAYGTVTTLETLQKFLIPEFIIKGMNIGGSYYHPTFFYESLWCLLGFIALLIFRRRKYVKIGQTTGAYLIWYGFGRFFIEALRTDSLMIGSLKAAQIVSIIMFISGILIIILKGRGSQFENQYHDVENTNDINY